jgi:glycosyltransferase involved in cell wall biosynthesis
MQNIPGGITIKTDIMVEPSKSSKAEIEPYMKPRERFVRHPNGNSPAEVKRLIGRDISKAETPIASVLIPTLDAYRNGYFPYLLEQLQEQTFQDFEVFIIKGDSRQGRAINVGASQAQGEILIILDDDIRLGHPEVFENLVITTTRHPEIGMAGVANVVPHDAPWIIKKVMNEVPRRSSDIVRRITESDMAEHPCCAIPKRIFYEVGGENEIMPRGLDPYLRAEIRKAGYKVVIIPNTYIHHLPPAKPMMLLKQFFRNGRQSAFCSKYYPQWIFELTEDHGADVPVQRSLVKRAAGSVERLIRALLQRKMLFLITSIAYQTGFIWEWLISGRKNRRVLDT